MNGSLYVTVVSWSVSALTQCGVVTFLSTNFVYAYPHSFLQSFAQRSHKRISMLQFIFWLDVNVIHRFNKYVVHSGWFVSMFKSVRSCYGQNVSSIAIHSTDRPNYALWQDCSAITTRRTYLNERAATDV
jgi:hypothetical protein